MSSLNKTHVEATTPHLMPRSVISKDLKAIGGDYVVKDEGDGKKSVTAKYIVDTDWNGNNGYVEVQASATYEKNKAGDGFVLVEGTGKMSATARNIKSDSAAALEKYSKSHSGQLLADKTRGMAEAMKILLTIGMEAKLGDTPSIVKTQDTFGVGVEVKSKSKVDVSVSFVDKDKTPFNSSTTVTARQGNMKYDFKVPADVKAGDYTLVVTFEDLKTGEIKTEEKPIKVIGNVTGNTPSSFAPNQPPSIQDIKVIGTDKIEGMTYTITATEEDKKTKEKKQVGTFTSQPFTITDKGGQAIKFEAPEAKGFRKDVTYVVKFTKDGHELLTKTFFVGQATFTPGKVKPK